MKPGFILLEIIISIALGSALIGSLFTSYFQVNRIFGAANNLVSIDSRASILQSQLNRDLSGAFIPFVFEKLTETTTTTKTTVATTKKGKTTKETTTETEKETEKKEKPLDNAFVSKNAEKNLSVLSFITSNPLDVYGKAVPRIARVTYQLVPDKRLRGEKKVYLLMRNESRELPFKEPAEGKARGYEVVDGVRSMTALYEVQVPQEKQEGPLQKTEKEIKYEIVATWGPEQIKKFKRNFPHFVIVTISFWDQQKKRAKAFTFRTAIVADDTQPEPPKKQPFDKLRMSEKNQGKGKLKAGAQKQTGRGSQKNKSAQVVAKTIYHSSMRGRS